MQYANSGEDLYVNMDIQYANYTEAKTVIF